MTYDTLSFTGNFPSDLSETPCVTPHSSPASIVLASFVSDAGDAKKTFLISYPPYINLGVT